MSTCIDMTGQKYGKLTILERDTNRPTGKGTKAYWICQCDCGNIKSIVGTDIRNGKTVSCGCGVIAAAKARKKDLKGEKFGRLLVIRDSGQRKNNRVVWECQCNCGNVAYVVSSYLLSGETQSCGCLQKERTAQAVFDDITNCRFGKLIALSPTKKRDNHSVVWKCQCDCGNIVYVSGTEMRKGHTSSCGCLKESLAVTQITELLNKNNISYEKEKTFNSCRFPDTNALARFDFYIQNKYLLEYDGEQHFKYSASGWNTKEDYQATIKRDEFKNQWCKENGIPLIRIPYTHKRDICLKDLLLETSQFKVK